jgi:CheY-like chemotaxis protein
VPASTPTPTILVVDDDQDLLILIEGALQAEKWNLATVTSGADALAWLKKNSADLLLLDLKLHDIDGWEFIGALADAGRSVPFIIITGQGDERMAVDMMKRGALDYLVKEQLERDPDRGSDNLRLVLGGQLGDLPMEPRCGLAHRTKVTATRMTVLAAGASVAIRC